MANAIERFIDRWKSVLIRVASIPLVFLGVGFYRAWIATLFRYGAYGDITSVDHYFLFEVSIGIVCFVFAFAARWVAPIWSKRSITIGTASAMLIGSVLIMISGLVVQSDIMKLIGLVLAGGGLAPLILMWAEFYGSLNPMRVALYHAMGIFMGEALKWLFLGLSVPYLAFFTIVLPLLSLACVRSSMRRLPERDLPYKPKKESNFTFPWKPILLMSACTFASGFGAFYPQPLIPANAIGAMVVTALVFFGVLSASKWFNFDTIYQLAFPLFIIAFIFIMPTFGAGQQIMAFCFDAGYTMLSMFIVLVLSNITYRFGINAVWLNGIERGIRYIVEVLGWLFFAWVSTNTTAEMTAVIYMGIVFVMVAIFTVIFFTERGLSARWGISVHEVGDVGGAQSPGQISMKVSELSKAHNLSPREEEVFQLLARKESMAQIESDLYVAHGTIKAHISHIYRKLGVHSREELYELLEQPEGLA